MSETTTPTKRRKLSEERASQAFVAASTSASRKPSPPRGTTNSSNSACAVVATIIDEDLSRAELSDVWIAIQMIRDKFPKCCKTELIPIVLKTQLYSSISNHTLVDRELERLKQENKIRIFEMLTTTEAKDSDCYFVLTSDYQSTIKIASQTYSETKDWTSVFGKFEELLSKCTETKIKAKEFIDFFKDEDKSKAIQVLAHSGFICQKLNFIFFAIPNSGRFLQMIREGREEVLKLIRNHKPVPEILLRDLLNETTTTTTKLKQTILGIEFHLSDLLGLSLIKQIESPLGSIIKTTE